MSTSKRILLVEGQDGAFLPEHVYCRQDDKVWFAHGGGTALAESMGGMTVVESIDQLDLEERQLPDGRKVKLPKDGVWVVEGPSQKSDTKNANRRHYPREIWEKWIQDANSPAQQAIKGRAMVGHLEHPKDGRTDGNEGALLVTEATLRQDGVVWCKFELLDTPKGLILQEYTRKGVRWGVSSRGNGSVDETGRVNPDDYVLETWDAVMRPSVAGSHPRLVASESQDETTNTPAVVEREEDLPAELTSGITVVESLCEQSIDGMTSDERLDLSADLLSAMRNIREHVSNAHPRVRKAVAAAFWKVAAIQESRTLTVDEAIDEACREAGCSAEDGDGSAHAEVIAMLQRRVGDAMTEAEELRAQLEVAESRALQATWRAQEIEEQLTEARTAQSRLALAEELLAERPVQEVQRGPVLDAVDEAVERFPELSEVRALLERGESVDEVESAVSAIVAMVLRESEDEPDTVTESVETESDEDHSWPALAHGALVSESDIDPGEEEPKPLVETSRGATLARAAIRSHPK